MDPKSNERRTFQVLAGKRAQGESAVEKAAAPGFQTREEQPPETCQLESYRHNLSYQRPTGKPALTTVPNRQAPGLSQRLKGKKRKLEFFGDNEFYI